MQYKKRIHNGWMRYQGRNDTQWVDEIKTHGEHAQKITARGDCRNTLDECTITHTHWANALQRKHGANALQRHEADARRRGAQAGCVCHSCCDIRIQPVRLLATLLLGIQCASSGTQCAQEESGKRIRGGKITGGVKIVIKRNLNIACMTREESHNIFLGEEDQALGLVLSHEEAQSSRDSETQLSVVQMMVKTR